MDFPEISKQVYNALNKDKSARAFLAFILWILVLAIAHFFTFQNEQQRIYEVPFARWIRAPEIFTVWDMITAYPFSLIFLPIILLITVPICIKFFDFTERLEKETVDQLSGGRFSSQKKIDWLNIFFKPAVTFLFFWLPYLIISIFSSDSVDGKIELTGVLIFFGMAIFFFNLFIFPEPNEKSPTPVGVSLFFILVGLLCLWITGGVLVDRTSKYASVAEVREAICNRVSLVTIRDEKPRIGWLIGKDKDFWIIREKRDGVYQTTELPNNQVKEVTYHERFNSISEKILAFPKCNI